MSSSDPAIGPPTESRCAPPRRHRHTAAMTRLAAAGGAAVVAGIAAWASWRHMVEVATTFGEDPLVSKWAPVSVDGMLVVASAVMADDKANGRRPRTSAKIAFAVGIAASLAANIAAADPTIGARIVAAWPPVALFLVVEMLTRRGKADPEPKSNAASPDSATLVVVSARPDATDAATAASPNSTPERRPDTATEEAALPAQQSGFKQPPTAPPESMSTESAVRAAGTPSQRPRRARPPVLTSRTRVERAVAARPSGTPAQIAADAAVSESTARRYMPRRTESAEANDHALGDAEPATLP